MRRLCRELRPPLLDDLGLAASVRQLVADFKIRAGCRVSLEMGVDEERGPLPTEVSLCAYRVVQEALTNISRHAHASRVGVQVFRDGRDLVVTVTDDGRGFEMEHLPATSGLGLTGMLERAALVDGHLEIRSDRQGGTSVALRVRVPVAERVEVS